MNENTSCCGVVCTICEHFPGKCQGCAKIEGKPFWLKFIGEHICSIYHCCIEKKGLHHCGQCDHLPCDLYTQAYDPTKTKAENESILRKQLEELERMKKSF
ncbi:DUF3795 domain-containing protein [Anaerotignum sp.]|uniref:DUF3795 domain-containing protein n=1 Tax=Anaerotignum sp. TaxID=2039241 RepID=UPI0027148D19|nr:DUF3795 domain-containing protein [Anaerotignum sp.]